MLIEGFSFFSAANRVNVLKFRAQLLISLASTFMFLTPALNSPKLDLSNPIANYGENTLIQASLERWQRFPQE
jgi:hypothetical protein